MVGVLASCSGEPSRSGATTQGSHSRVRPSNVRTGIGFIPWFPLGAGDLAKPGSFLDHLARKTGFTPSQIALAWVLKRSRVMLAIPGTSKVKHLEENVAAANFELSESDYAKLDALGHAAPETPGPGA